MCGAAVLMALALVMMSVGLPAQAPQTGGAAAPAPTLTPAQVQELVALRALTDAVLAGEAAPNDLTLTWMGADVLKAAGNAEYVPFTVTVDSAAVTGGVVSVYWRVVSKAAAAAPVVAPDPAATTPPPPAAPVFAYENLSTVNLGGQPAPARISRSFVVPPGAYDVYVVVKEPASADATAPAPKSALITQSVEVPDFWSPEFNASSIIVADRIEPVAVPLTPEQAFERPYVLGSIELVPSLSSRYGKSGELLWFFFIYNAKGDSRNKPDVSVEYNFYKKDAAGAEAYYNKMAPQPLNAETLPAEFNLAAGHQLQTGQALPLQSFPEGDYRLEIKVTDRLANATISRDVNFTVAGL